LKKSSTKNFNVGSFFNKETRSVSVKSFEGVRGNFFKSFPENLYLFKSFPEKKSLSLTSGESHENSF